MLSVTLDFAQEYRAERAIDKLRESVSCTATLLRDGIAVELPLREVVPGDVALLRAGVVVPADGVLLDARDLFVNQALLTGEPFPVEKHLQAALRPAAGADGDTAPHALFMNTSVVSGTARMRVERTGSGSRLARFAALQADGLRVIAVAWREAPRGQEHAVIDDEEGSIFSGFTAFFDPPRAEAGEAVVALALWLPFIPLAGLFGFVPLPPAYFAVLAVMLTVYLLLVKFTKRVFFRRLNHFVASRNNQ